MKKIVGLFFGIFLLLNSSFAQNEKLKWLEGKWEGKGVFGQDRSEIIKCELSFDSKTQLLTIKTTKETFYKDFKNADKGTYDTGDKIRVFIDGDITALNKNIYISKHYEDASGKYLIVSCFFTRQKDNLEFFAILKKQ
jgi:hypothetical protein